MDAPLTDKSVIQVASNVLYCFVNQRIYCDVVGFMSGSLIIFTRVQFYIQSERFCCLKV